MRRELARLGALLLVSLSFLGFGAPTAQAEPLTPMTRFGSCLAGGGQGNVIMLLDRSGSLQRSDPESGRLAAAKQVVQQFAGTVAGHANMSLNLAVSSFDATYEKTLDWTPINADSVSTIQAHLDTYAQSNTGRDTDYWTALDGARKEFAAAQSSGTNCNLLLWFSDGAYDIEIRADDADLQRSGGPKAWAPDNKLLTREDVNSAMAAAEADMCRSGGLADQLRSMGIASVGLGLAVTADEASFDLMRNFVTGGGGCGTVTDPVPGQFLMSADVDSLIFDFITVMETGSDPEENRLCVGQICEEGTRTFVLDGSIGAVAATAKAPLVGTKVYLQPRLSEAIELAPGNGNQQLEGAKLEWKWVSDRVVTVNLTRDGQTDAWAGPWSIAFVAEEATDELAKSTISLKGDITPQLLNDDVELRAGAEDAQLQLGVVDRTGNRIDPTTLSDQTRLEVDLVTANGTETLASGLTRADIEKPIAMPLRELSPGAAELRLTLDITTQAWSDGARTVPGTRLEPQSATYRLTIAAPADYPAVPDKVDFGNSETVDPVTIDVPITGEGCVWLAGETSFTGYPTGQESATLTSPSTSRDSCASGTLRLTLDPVGLGNGSFTGVTTVMLASNNSAAEAVPAQVSFTLSQSRPASQPVLWGTLIGVTLLGVAIPVGILYLTKYLTAKIPGNAVLGASASGLVNQSTAFTDNGVPITADQLRMAHLTNRRVVSVAGKTLRARMGLALTEPGYVVVDTAGPSVGGRGTLQSVGGNAKLPLGVQGTWMVELDPNRPVSGPVLITVFTAPGAPGMGELFDDIRSNIRTAVDRLREGLPPEPGPGADPWGGGGAPQPAADPWATPQAAAPSPGSQGAASGPLYSAGPVAGASTQPVAPGSDGWDSTPTHRIQPPADDPWANPPSGTGANPNTW